MDTTTTTRIAVAALIVATALGLSACAPTTPIDIAKAKIDQVAKAIRNGDGAAIGDLSCGEPGTAGWGGLTPEGITDYGAELPIEVKVEEVENESEGRFEAEQEEFGGDVYIAQLTIPALAPGSDEAATPVVAVIVNDGDACVIYVGS